MLLEKGRNGSYDGFISIITQNKEKAFIKPIPLRIEQRRSSAAQIPKSDDEKPADYLRPCCCECFRVIKGEFFQCFQCADVDYNMCGSCVSSGKHSMHNIIIRATKSKVCFNHNLLMISIGYTLCWWIKIGEPWCYCRSDGCLVEESFRQTPQAEIVDAETWGSIEGFGKLWQDDSSV